MWSALAASGAAIGFMVWPLPMAIETPVLASMPVPEVETVVEAPRAESTQPAPEAPMRAVDPEPPAPLQWRPSKRARDTGQDVPTAAFPLEQEPPAYTFDEFVPRD
jgi:hypothetical protein